jgi:4-amino-4-deoxy-L-arabinose transferase-like glycosyltransferase
MPHPEEGSEKKGTKYLFPAAAAGNRYLVPFFSSRRRLLLALTVLLPLGWLAGTGLAGVDFGFYWDDGRTTDPVRQAVEHSRLLPGFYRYPGVSYWLTVAGAGIESLPAIRAGARTWTELRDHLRPALGSPGYVLLLRKLFLLVSAAALVWTFLAALARGRHWIEALLAASILGCSWEVAYHLRWVAPDGVLMQFGALTLLCVIAALRHERPRAWIALAAVAAGLATGTKYPGGLLLVPVLLAAVAAHRRGALPGALSGLLRPLVLFTITYLLTTPGTLLEPAKFVEDVLYEMQHYRSGHSSHQIGAGPEHLLENLRYLALVLLSPAPLAAAFWSALALVGAAALWRESRLGALAFLSFPLLYLLQMSSQRAMLVRNLLVLAPFLALLAARGAAVLWRRCPGRAVRAAFGALVVGLVLVDAARLLHAARTIRAPDPARDLRELAAWARARPDTRFIFSDRLQAALARAGEPLPPNLVTEQGRPYDRIAFYALEAFEAGQQIHLNVPLHSVWFGPWDVNIDYYPSWLGSDRIVILEQTRVEMWVRRLRGG